MAAVNLLPHTTSIRLTRTKVYGYKTSIKYQALSISSLYRVTQKKWELLENSTKIEEIQEKKITDRN
jgi:hypothetical protein